MNRSVSVLLFILMLRFSVYGQPANFKTETSIHYYSDAENKADPYKKERGVLDVFYPPNGGNLPVIIWFHGGGLTGGEKFIPEQLKNGKYVVVAANYRFYPKVKCPAYIEDAAAATAWVFNNIKKYGGNPSLIFISGHSAGGYLASMIGLDKKWLSKHQIDANKIAGLAPFSGHGITHMTVREERGIPKTQAVIDEFAPIFWARADAPPLLLITGDRELEMLGRYEENAYLLRMMKLTGHTQTTLYEMDGYGHDMTIPGYPLLMNFIDRIAMGTGK
ncbi:hypothetical protein DYBT9275_01989 [Dyadobacter sp. CECT 9275]|uniref:BD-FAE-like domain-containing protein n=1 Tax=Dyadobacter helix TaxID=2822344 RepID=A0A916JB23_9BACT|nr:alpha/beta hydrolase [Dyadobacter sp. CECT 9275]CAG4998383.1 hypothetical protein DYBT9275_01989 [Dyadobacter sp. CECT 9275]